MLLFHFGCCSLCLYYSLLRLACLFCLYRTRSFSRCWLLFRHLSLSLALSASHGCSLQFCLLCLFLAHFPSHCCSRLFCLHRLFLARSASCCCSLLYRLLFLALSSSCSVPFTLSLCSSPKYCPLHVEFTRLLLVNMTILFQNSEKNCCHTIVLLWSEAEN